MANKIKEINFAREYLRTGSASQAAQNIGYAKSSAGPMGAVYLKKPSVQEIIEKEAKELQKKTQHTILDAMKEAEEAMAFAKETENANAYVKAVELRAKLNGLLIEKHSHQMAGFVVSVGGIDFSKRDGVLPEPKDVQQLPEPPPSTPIDESGDLF